MTEQSQPDKAGPKVKVYLLIAYASLLLIALLWSVSSAFVYFFSGSSSICLYLGIRNYLTSRTQQGYTSPRPGYRPRLDNFQRMVQSQSVPGRSIKIPKGVVLIIGMITVVVLVSVFLFVSNDDDSEFYYQAGNSYYQAGQYDSAVIFFRHVLNQQSDHVDALLAYGNAKLALIQNDSAILYYDKVLALDGENLQAKFQKGRTLYFNKDYQQCIPMLETLVLSDSGNNEAMQLIGDSFYNQQKYDSALKWYESAYSTGYRNTYLCYLMGYIYETKSNNNRAVALYKEAIGFDDTIADLYSRLGVLVSGTEGESYRAKAASLEAESKH